MFWLWNYGHSKEKCEGLRRQKEDNGIDSHTNPKTEHSEVPASEVVEMFGPWMFAETRRHRLNLRTLSSIEAEPSVPTGSHFAALGIVEEESATDNVVQKPEKRPSIAATGKSNAGRTGVSLQKGFVKNMAYIVS
ncbi:hypothetical protein V6N12_049201 [Hibiscus sabdariffa]|uniref:Uncharacterized protein n=1 Tax=Hibiscus sabdariffa TaxID=183260 RepID=A0ABR2EJH4_9ROSI